MHTLSILNDGIVPIVTTSAISGDASQPTEVLIVGAGGLGREARDAMETSTRHRFAGFLDDDRSLPDVVGSLDDEAAIGTHGLIIAIGDPAVRLSVLARLGAGARFVTVVHSSAVVSPSASIGAGCLVSALSYVGPRARIGNHVLVNVHAEVGHDSVIGDFATLSPMAVTNGAVRLGEGVFMGTQASVGVGVSVGRWSKVASGARVDGDVGEGFLVAGNPARGRRLFRVHE